MSKIRTFLVTSEFFAPKCLPLVWKNFLIHTNIAQAPDMTCLEERKIGAIVGALVADAAGKLCSNLVRNMCRFPGKTVLKNSIKYHNCEKSHTTAIVLN